MNANHSYAEKIMNLMQFARRAGKLVSGTDACLRGIYSHKVHLVVIAEDASERTFNRINNATKDYGGKIQVIRLGLQAGYSAALGLPLTAVFGVGDRQFADKMLEYYAAG